MSFLSPPTHPNTSGDQKLFVLPQNAGITPNNPFLGDIDQTEFN
jgi:hypothetical protein